MAERYFVFVQMELPWELGPPDGRYLLRKAAGPQESEPEHVLVLSTVGAERRGLLRHRARKRRTSAEPATVPVTCATAIDAVALSAEHQARAWLTELDPEREAQAAAAALNRLLFAHRIASAGAYVREVSPTQALIVRAGFGVGEQVAEGMWTDARELVLSKRSIRRAAVLHPQERLASLLSGKDKPALLCEELALRARADLDQGRIRHASIELERAYAAALNELPREERESLVGRVEELRELYAGVQAAAQIAIGERADESPVADSLDETAVAHALERLETALRARTFGVRFSVEGRWVRPEPQ